MQAAHKAMDEAASQHKSATLERQEALEKVRLVEAKLQEAKAQAVCTDAQKPLASHNDTMSFLQTLKNKSQETGNEADVDILVAMGAQFNAALKAFTSQQAKSDPYEDWASRGAQNAQTWTHTMPAQINGVEDAIAMQPNICAARPTTIEPSITHLATPTSWLGPADGPPTSTRTVKVTLPRCSRDSRSSSPTVIQHQMQKPEKSAITRVLAKKQQGDTRAESTDAQAIASAGKPSGTPPNPIRQTLVSPPIAIAAKPQLHGPTTWQVSPKFGATPSQLNTQVPLPQQVANVPNQASH